MHKVDLQFRVLGETIPADHGYALFGAVSRVVPEIHGDKDVGIHAINGFLVGNRMLALTPRSRLTVRIAADRIEPLLALCGRSLEVGGHRLLVGTPSTRALIPSPRLYSRLVVIKGYMEPEGFLEAVRERLAQLGCNGRPSLVPVKGKPMEAGSGTRSPYLRRTVRIAGKEIVGFAVRIEDLTPQESILIQEQGIGGRRRFGCGIFIPDRT